MIILLLFLSLFLFPSCSPLFPEEDNKIYVISVADNFSNPKANTGDSKPYLKNVLNDQAAFISQMQKYDNVEIKAYIVDALDKSSQNGGEGRYISTHPEFYAVNKSKAEVSPNSSTFSTFRYRIPKREDSNTKKFSWGWDDVIKDIQNLEVDDKDIVIFSYSGHGWSNTNEKHAKGDLVLSIVNSAQGQYDTLSLKRLKAVLDSINGNKIVLLDSCFSGTFLDWCEPSEGIAGTDVFRDGATRYLEGTGFAATVYFPLPPKKNETNKIWAISATTRDQVSFDASPYSADGSIQSHFGCLSYYLLEALGYNFVDNEARDVNKRVSFLDIYDHVRSNLKEEVQKGIANGRDVGQTPQATMNLFDILIHK